MSALLVTTGGDVGDDIAAAKHARPWWMDHSYHEEKQANFDGLAEFPEGSFELLDSLDDRNSAKELKAKIDEGDYSDLAAILFMINGHKPGPVPGFYVIVETVKAEGWCVGQLHADGATPLRVFRNPVYPSQEEARQAAMQLRLADLGNAPSRA